MKRLFCLIFLLAPMLYTASTIAQVTGSVTEVDARYVFCKNHTTDQSVRARTESPYWNCEAMGLQVNPGDRITTGVIGLVSPNQATCLQPVAESGINNGPGNTGWPYQLSNRISFNVSGEITRLGVDRWDREGLFWTVFLWDSSCNLIATTSINGGVGWYFGDITPVSVNSGEVYLVGYEVSAAEGSYLYRDTVSPIDLGAYTVLEADFGSVGACPSDINGFLVSPVDVEICTQDEVLGQQQCSRGNALGNERVNTDSD